MLEWQIMLLSCVILFQLDLTGRSPSKIQEAAVNCRSLIPKAVAGEMLGSTSWQIKYRKQTSNMCETT